MRESLLKIGFIEKKVTESNDFYIINSCTVTQKADTDTRNFINRFRKINPKSKIVVTGCYAELEKDRSLLKNMGVDYLVRNKEKAKIAEIIGQVSGVILKTITDFKDKNRAFVKIQDGCNHRCSYCKVRIVRGPSKSRETSEILEEAASLIKRGFKEIVLTGICLGAWGRDLKKKDKLAILLKRILKIEGDFRIRLSSIEPVYVTDDVIKVFKNDKKICKHLHIPLQSGDDKILKVMNRPYTTKNIERLVRSLRKHIPDIAITTDVLVGFSGEDDKSFLRTQKFLEKIKPSRMHLFSYSAREGTTAFKLKNGPAKDIVKKRVRTLDALGNKLSMDFAKRFIDKSEKIVVESSRDRKTGMLVGYTDRYIRVLTSGDDSIKNSLISVRIKTVDIQNRKILACLECKE